MNNLLLGAGIALVVLVVIAAGAAFWVFSSINTERVSALTVANPEGSAGTALLVLHPGLGDFPERVATAFGEGLAEQGWRLERTTASREAPADLAGYDLLVVAAPVYGGMPPKPVQDYLARLAMPGGLNVAVVLTGAGDTAAALEATAGLVEQVRGTVVGRYAYTTMRPNEPPAGTSYPGSNVEIAIAMARDAGGALAPAP